MATSTPLGSPGFRPMGSQRPQSTRPQAASALPTGAEAMTLGTLREVRNELANLGDLLDRMTKEMASLRGAVQLMAERQGRFAASEGGDNDGAPGELEALRAQLAALEKRVRKDRKQASAAAAEHDEREADMNARIKKLESRVAKLKRQLAWAS